MLFCVQSWKFYTWQNIFTRAVPVVPITNIRHDHEINTLSWTFLRNINYFHVQSKKLGACDKYEVWFQSFEGLWRSNTAQWFALIYNYIRIQIGNTIYSHCEVLLEHKIGGISLSLSCENMHTLMKTYKNSMKHGAIHEKLWKQKTNM